MKGGPALSHLGLRKGVGFLGLALPVVLALGKFLLDGGGIQGSLSGYYYTVMRDYFVGSNCATATLLLCYRYRREDGYLSAALAASAVGLALFPTNPPGVAGLTAGQSAAGGVHLVCSTLYFLGQAYFCFAVFTRTDPGSVPTPRKLQRNIVYRVSGIAIVVCLVLIAVANQLLTKELRDQFHPVFWLESVAVWAFSVCWLIKGRALFLKDT